MRKIFIFILILFFSSSNVFAARFYNEKYYQNKWCQRWHGKQEVILKDKTRIDCMTKNYVVEFDFAKKWAEAVGQSLHYARVTGKQPGIILIIETPKDMMYYKRVKPLCKQYNIALWYMKSPVYNMKNQVGLIFNIF